MNQSPLVTPRLQLLEGCKGLSIVVNMPWVLYALGLWDEQHSMQLLHSCRTRQRIPPIRLFLNIRLALLELLTLQMRLFGRRTWSKARQARQDQVQPA